MLAPAAELSPRKRRTSLSANPAPLLGASQRKHHSDLSAEMSSKFSRPGILRMPSQQAEKDAVDTLLFMSSPKPNPSWQPPNNAEGRTQPSPLKTEYTGRRVMFDTDPPSERGPTAPLRDQYGAYAAYRRSDLGR